MGYIDPTTRKQLCQLVFDPDLISRQETVRVKYYLWFTKRCLEAMDQLGGFCGYCTAPPYDRLTSKLLKTIQRDAADFGVTIQKGSGEELVIFLNRLKGLGN